MRDQQPEPVVLEGDVLVLDRDQFGAAQRTGIAEQQQRAVALADRRVCAGCDQGTHLLGVARAAAWRTGRLNLRWMPRSVLWIVGSAAGHEAGGKGDAPG